MMIVTRPGTLTPPAALRNANPGIQKSGGSFQNQVLSALQKYLEENGEDTGPVRIEIRREPSQNPAGRQFLVTVTGASHIEPEVSRATGATPATPATPASKTDTATIPAAPALPAIASTASSSRLRSSVDNYWDMQPPEVRELRYMETEAQRTERARELAARGFSIDVPIMVWQWDPLATMTARQNMGYTWVPAAHMSPVASAPGIGFAGIAPYDPDHPPAGAIKVTTEFAKGATAEEPWVGRS